MSLVQQSGARRFSLRGSAAYRPAGVRVGLETLIFVLAFGFTIAVVLGLIP